MKWVTFSDLAYVVSKIKLLFVAKESGKGLSTNDLTEDLKSNYDDAYTHSTSTHAPSGAQANVIEKIKVNGTVLTPDSSKAVNVPGYAHPNSGATAGTYKSVMVNAQGHVTDGSNPTTLAGYGITDAYTKTVTDAKISEAVANAGHLKRSLVTTLPSAGSADVNTIYMIKDATATGDDKYKEYMLINNALVMIGDTSVNLSEYIRVDDIELIETSEIDALFS